jgi:hypothetical protein
VPKSAKLKGATHLIPSHMEMSPFSISVDLHFVRERVAASDVRVLSVHTMLQGLSSNFDPVSTFVQARVETTGGVVLFTLLAIPTHPL